jgi:hypothetical protein
MIDFFNIDSFLSEDERAVRDSVRRFVDERVLPIIGSCYVDGRFPREILPTSPSSVYSERICPRSTDARASTTSRTA